MGATLIPSALPNPLAQYSFESQSISVNKLMDSGRIRQYPRSTKAPRKVRVVWFLTDPLLEVFKIWYNIGIAAGTQKFVLKLAFGNSCRLNTALFLSDYRVTSDTLTGWRVDAELEVEDPV